MKVVISFRHWSLKTDASNLKEIYLNKHTEGESYRVSIKDDSLVEIVHYKADAKIYKHQFEHSTIYEGVNDDVPHIYFRLA